MISVRPAIPNFSAYCTRARAEVLRDVAAPWQALQP